MGPQWRASKQDMEEKLILKVYPLPESHGSKFSRLNERIRELCRRHIRIFAAFTKITPAMHVLTKLREVLACQRLEAEL